MGRAYLPSILAHEQPAAPIRIGQSGAVRAADFDLLFDSLVVEPTASAGFQRWGSGLWFEVGGLRAALLRTELRHTWPFAFTLVVGHTCLRNFVGQTSARSRNVSEWPIKVRPSQAPELATAGWRYRPYNLGRYPQDRMTAGEVQSQLAAIERGLSATFPAIVDQLTHTLMVEQLKRNGEQAWCEMRWIEDYEDVRRTS